MIPFQVDRTQFPIGQGGFHATVIHLPYNNRRLSMVIDCGGANEEHRNLLINGFAESGRQHDILVISHFDEDHINGVDDLHTAGIRFETVFLPHVDIQSYLLWMTLKISACDEKEAKDLARVVRIAGRLYGGNYGHVVLVGPQSLASREPQPGDLSEDANLADMLSDEAYKAIQKARGVPGQVFSCSQSLNMKNIDWLFRFYSREWTFPHEVEDIWNLSFFAKLKAVVDRTKQKLNDSEWGKFATDLELELKAKIAPADADQVMTLTSTTTAKKSIPLKSLKKLKDEIKNGKNGGLSCKCVLSQLYIHSVSLKDYNDASLCVYSGPALRGTGARREQFSRSVQLGRRDLRLRPDSLDGVRTREVGWIATGDSDFSTWQKLQDFLKHYHTETILTSVFVLPHHGSRNSYDEHMDRLRELIANLSEKPLFIAPANPEHKTYHHPHWQVESTCRKDGNFYIVDQELSSFYLESVYTSDDLSKLIIWK